MMRRICVLSLCCLNTFVFSVVYPIFLWFEFLSAAIPDVIFIMQQCSPVVIMLRFASHSNSHLQSNPINKVGIRIEKLLLHPRLLHTNETCFHSHSISKGKDTACIQVFFKKCTSHLITIRS